MVKTKNKKNKQHDLDNNNKKNEFAFYQAEQALNASIEFSNAIENKATNLIAYLIAIFTVSVGTFFTALFDLCHSFHRPSILISLFLFNFLVFNLIRNTNRVLMITEYHSAGNLPNNLLNDKNENYAQLKESEAKHYNDYILTNREKNKDKAKLLRAVHDRLIEAIYIPLLVFVLAEYFLGCGASLIEDVGLPICFR